MFHLLVLNPEIPPNAGNMIRMSANTGIDLHFIEPMGFRVDDKSLKRAGLDYHDAARLHIHPDLSAAFNACGDGRRFAVTAGGGTRFDRERYRRGDIFLLGRESTGLPDDVLAMFDPRRRLHIPMQPKSRSYNLANAAAIIALEAWRQNDFCGCESPASRHR